MLQLGFFVCLNTCFEKTVKISHFLRYLLWENVELASHTFSLSSSSTIKVQCVSSGFIYCCHTSKSLKCSPLIHKLILVAQPKSPSLPTCRTAHIFIRIYTGQSSWPFCRAIIWGSPHDSGLNTKYAVMKMGSLKYQTSLKDDTLGLEKKNAKLYQFYKQQHLWGAGGALQSVGRLPSRMCATSGGSVCCWSWWS